MFFTITAYKGLLGLGKDFRLKKDRTWQKIEDFNRVDREEDMLFTSYRNAQLFVQSRPQFEIEGEPMDWEKYESTRVGDFGSTFHFKILVHRTEKPRNPYPTKEQVREVLVSGDDDYNNSLTIDFDGFPRLIQRRDRLDGYPVRCETFGAGNGYVGPMSQLNHLNGTYKILLEGWLFHLESGQTTYKDCLFDHKSEEQFIQEIQTELDKLV